MVGTRLFIDENIIVCFIYFFVIIYSASIVTHIEAASDVLVTWAQLREYSSKRKLVIPITQAR